MLQFACFFSDSTSLISFKNFIILDENIERKSIRISLIYLSWWVMGAHYILLFTFGHEDTVYDQIHLYGNP